MSAWSKLTDTVFNQSMTEQKHNNTGCVYNAQPVIIYEVIQQQEVKSQAQL